jgi:hypothetical protein
VPSGPEEIISTDAVSLDPTILETQTAAVVDTTVNQLQSDGLTEVSAQNLTSVLETFN